MRHLVRLDAWSADDLDAVFDLADAYAVGSGPRFDGAAALFLPPTSLRTRIAFERGAARMGLQPILFPPEALDSGESPDDLAGYLAVSADIAVVRHADAAVVDRLAAADRLPIVNAMTAASHPCEILADLFALRAEGPLDRLRFLFVGADGNIGRSWADAAGVLGLDLVQCGPAELAIDGVAHTEDLATAIRSADVVLTDPPGGLAEALAPYRITAELLAMAPDGVRFAPCPPFARGREATADVFASPAFVGYGFKRALVPVQQAVLASCLGG